MKAYLLFLTMLLTISLAQAKEMELVGYQETDDCKSKSVKVNSTIDEHGQQRYTIINDNCK